MTIAPADRAAVLRDTRQRKMAQSVHAYVRGNTARFYDWLGASPVAKLIPEGPPIWICGDCHLGNLGPIADADGRIAIQIRDLDQTVIGNPALDLVRLGLSLETAARSSDLPGVTTARMIEAMADSYCRALDALEAIVPEPMVVRALHKRAAKRRWRHLAEERISGTDLTIPLGKRFWPLAGEERAALDSLFSEWTVRHRVRELAGVGAKGKARVVDYTLLNWRGDDGIEVACQAAVDGPVKKREHPARIAGVESSSDARHIQWTVLDAESRPGESGYTQ